MSFGGDGITEIKPVFDIGEQTGSDVHFQQRRFRAGGRLHLKNNKDIDVVAFDSCVLCGGLIIDDDATDEHPLPQWLQKYTGATEHRSKNLMLDDYINPTWRQLCLKAHADCNKLFGKLVEQPAISAVKSAVEGRHLTSNQIDALFDWLDKVKSSSAHMGVALGEHYMRMDYAESSFPNRRMGSLDRFALFIRIDTDDKYLDMWDTITSGFLSTPSSIVLRINNLIIVYVSGAYALSEAFGLSTPMIFNDSWFVTGNTGMFQPGFVVRKTRLPTAKIIAQPMRRQHMMQFGIKEVSSAVEQNGDGKSYELIGTRWQRIRQTSFAKLPVIRRDIAETLASLECLEWILWFKDHDTTRLRSGSGRFHLESYAELYTYKLGMLERLSELRLGIRLIEQDRIPINYFTAR